MFAQLPKLFDRNFAIGYFLPFASFLAATGTTLHFIDSRIRLEIYFSSDLLVGTTLLGLTTWIGGVILLLVNRGLIRFLEGYGVLSWIWLPHEVQLFRYRKLRRRLELIDRDWIAREARGEEILPELQAERMRIMKALVERYPDHEDLLLPTALGNAIRAFEVYPRVMYGLEGIHGWLRILPFVPDEYRKIIEEAKVKLDFWVNVVALAAVYILIYFIAAHWTGGTKPIALLLPLTALVLLSWCYSKAVNAARLWGEFVKAAFDVYHGELAAKLGYALPADADARRVFWTSYSQAMIYRSPDSLPANPTVSPPPPIAEPAGDERNRKKTEGIWASLTIKDSEFQRLSPQTQRELIGSFAGRDVIRPAAPPSETDDD